MMSIQFPLLVGHIVCLREFSSKDITEEYISWLNDPLVTKYSNQRFIHHTKESCISYLYSFAHGNNLFLNIISVKEGRSLGTMTIYYSPHHQTADIGIMIGDKTCWGSGVGWDAWNLLTNWLLKLPNVRKITAGTLRENQAMIHIIEKSGMQLEGARFGQELLNNQPVDVLYFGKFRGH